MTLRPGLGATYRLQLVPGFGFTEAALLVPYLASLGIETVYCSPVAEAVPGSLHGYDGTDPTRLRAELGADTGWAALVAACEAQGLGILVDHVPNHLATWPGGPWWRRLLAEGRTSPVAEFFDVHWDTGPPATRGKVTLPLLDRPLPEALAAGLVRLSTAAGSAAGGSAARQGAGPETVIRIGVDTGPGLPVAGGTARPGEDVAEVLAAQHYRLVDWHDQADRNYRRFFDIDGLVGVRVEVPKVFEATHALVVSLAERGHLSALRVDHVDGLRDPARYLRRLAEATGVPIVVEKILNGDERLVPAWPVAGTTGYDVVDDVGGALVTPDGLERLVAAARTEGDPDPGPLTVETRRLVCAASFPADMARLAGGLGVDPSGLTEAVVRLPVYRTYLEGDAVPPSDDALWRSLGVGPDAGDPLADDVIDERAATQVTAVVGAVLDPARRPATLGLQQLTGAVMAKGVEDTAWYRLAGPLAFCEVGGDPGRDRHGAVERLVGRAAARAAAGKAGLIPGTTHDTKRSLDVRARLTALSELAERFEEGLAGFRRHLGVGGDAGAGTEPGRDDFLWETRMLAQVLLAVVPPLRPSSPMSFLPPGDADWPAGDRLAARVHGALRKAAREAKLRSSWLKPDDAYEARLCQLATTALDDRGALLRRSFGNLVDEVTRLGAVNSLAAVVLRHALPGVPDCYQGDEVWNLSLVDPDNRRPIAVDLLAAAMAALPEPEVGTGPGEVESLRRSWRDGRVKLFVTARCLRARRRAPGAFDPSAQGSALAAEGPAAGSILPLVRRGRDGSWAVAVVTRLPGRLAAAPGDLPAGHSYAGTTLRLPDGAPPTLVDALSGTAVRAGERPLALDHVLGSLPVALLIGSRG